MNETVSVKLDFRDLTLLAEAYWYEYKNIDNLPAKQQDKITMAGWSLRQTGQNFLRRHKELKRIIDETWPK